MFCSSAEFSFLHVTDVVRSENFPSSKDLDVAFNIAEEKEGGLHLADGLLIFYLAKEGEVCDHLNYFIDFVGEEIPPLKLPYSFSPSSPLPLPLPPLPISLHPHPYTLFLWPHVSRQLKGMGVIGLKAVAQKKRFKGLVEDGRKDRVLAEEAARAQEIALAGYFPP